MPDHPHEEAVQLLYAADEDHPAVGITLGDQGPRLSVNTGYTDDPVESQLSMIAAYVDWMADHTDVEPERVARDALEIVHEMRDDAETKTFTWDPDEISRE